jgi:hypothetical protein
VGDHPPDVAEGVLDPAAALSEGVVRQGSDDPAAGVEGPGERLVRVGHEHAEQARHDGPVGGSVEGQDDGVADPDLTVPDRPALGHHPPELLPAERRGDEVEKGSGVVGDDPGGDGGVARRRGVGLLGPGSVQ